MSEKEILPESENPRREFMQKSLLGASAFAGLSVATTSHAKVENPQKSLEPEVINEVDILVVGSGSAGTTAAIQAGRAGAKTLLMERNSQLGGLFDAWGKQVISGIGWELVKESVELDGGKFPDFSKVPRAHHHNQIHLNQFLYSILAEEKCQEAGVEIAYYEFPTVLTQTENGWQVDCVGFGTKRRVLCKQIIDCTGGAEVVGLIGLERLRGEERQPGSYLFKIGSSHNPASSQLNRLYVHGADSTNSRTVTLANLTGRKTILSRVRNGKGRLMHLQPETGFRESFRIIGDTVITVQDYTSGRHFEDAVSYAFYPVDLHTRTGVKPKPLKRGIVPTVPLSSLIPKGSKNIIVAGRCISSDRLANSALRVQAACMGMGQAAGATAALAAESNTTPLKVPLSKIHGLLREHNAIVPEKV
jgi:hypothetical protein